MLVDTNWLKENLTLNDLRIVDCRYVLGKPGEGKKLYEEGHIPGAIHLDIDKDLAGRSGPGRHPLPSPFQFSQTISNAGIDRSIHVIAYDDQGGAFAARLWWLLNYYGHERVSLLNGGLTEWIAKGGRISREIQKIKARSFKASKQPGWVVSKEWVNRALGKKEILLLDARAPERFSGEKETIDPKAGHIPGAKNSPFVWNLNLSSNTFKKIEILNKNYEKLGCFKAKEIVSYCGSGVTACLNIFGLKQVGLQAKLYEGSWSDWSADNSLPVEKGGNG